MEPEVERDPEKRRSSILKIPKARNPFEEIDVTETCTDISMFKPVRRVSFASSNFIKPFVADPEKNTIWDTTYEEDVNHTNSTQSSQEHGLTTCTKSGSTLFESVATSEVHLNTTTLYEHNMELTNVVSFADKENIPIYSQKKISIVDYARKLSNHEVLTQKPHIFDDFDDRVGNKTQMSVMEFTCQNLNNFIKSNERQWEMNDFQVPNYTIQQEIEMDLTETSICEEVEAEREKHQSNGSQMEFTCQVPVKINRPTSILKKQTDMEFTCQTDVTKPDDDMEFTCHGPQNNFTKGTDNMELTCQIPQCHFKKASDTMEFTCQIQNNVSKIYDNQRLHCQIPHINTGTDDNLEFRRQGNLTRAGDDMDFTCQVPQNKLIKVPIKKMQNDNDNMEFTCQIQNNVSKICDNQRLHSQIPYTNTGKYDNLEFRRQGNLTRVGDDMEFTCQVPQNNLIKVPISKMQNVNDNMEFTCQMSENNLTKCDGMEFTCQIPVNQIKNNNLDTEAKLGLTKKCANKTDYVENMSQGKILKDMELIDKTYNETESQVSCSKTIARSILEQKSCSDMEVDESYVNRITDRSESHQNLHIRSQNTTKNVKYEKELISSVSSEMPREKCENKVDADVTNFDNRHKNHDISAPTNVNEKNILKQMSYSDMEVDETYVNKSYIDHNNYQNSTKCNVSELKAPSISIHRSTTDVQLGKSNIVNDPVSIVDDSRAFESLKVGLLIDTTSQDKSKVPEIEDTQNSHYNKTYLKPTNQTFEVKNAEVATCHTPKTTTKSPKVSHIPIKTNSRLLTTPDRSIKLQNQKHQSELDLTSTSPMTEETIPAHKLPNLSSFKHDFSDLKTPEPSFHINLTNISSGVDDTQNLLQCTYSKPNPLLIRSRFEDKDEFVLNLEETANVSKPELTGMSRNFEETVDNSPDISGLDIPKCRSKLTNINDTYVLKNKKEIVRIDFEEETEDPDDDDTSVGILAEDCFQNLSPVIQSMETCLDNEDNKVKSRKLADFTVKECSEFTTKSVSEIYLQENVAKQEVAIQPVKTCRGIEVPSRKLEDFKVKQYPEFNIKRNSEISRLQENVAKQAAHMTNFLESFKFRSMRIPREFTVLEKSSMDCSEGSKEMSEESIKCPIVSTVEDNIRKRQESCLKCWKLEKVDDDFYHFSTLFGTLIFVVELDPETGKVVKIETCDKLTAASKPIARFIMKLFVEKLKESHIKSAIGSHCDILSLLDYVQMTMLQLHEFQKSFMKCEWLSMEEDFVAKYTILSVPLVLSCNILVDVSDLENLKCDKDIKVVTHIGIANENEIKNLAKNCAKGLDFFISFHKNLQEYLDIKRRKKR